MSSEERSSLQVVLDDEAKQAIHKAVATLIVVEVTQWKVMMEVVEERKRKTMGKKLLVGYCTCARESKGSFLKGVVPS